MGILLLLNQLLHAFTYTLLNLLHHFGLVEHCRLVLVKNGMLQLGTFHSSLAVVLRGDAGLMRWRRVHASLLTLTLNRASAIGIGSIEALRVLRDHLAVRVTVGIAIAWGAITAVLTTAAGAVAALRLRLILVENELLLREWP